MANPSAPAPVAWGMIFSLENADNPSSPHTAQEVAAIIRTWAALRSVKQEPLLANMTFTKGTVCFIDEKGAERTGTFPGCMIHGVSVLDDAQTRDMLVQLAGLFGEVLGQKIVEVHFNGVLHVKRVLVLPPTKITIN